MTKRYHRYGRRYYRKWGKKRKFKAGRAFKKAWHSWPSRFARRTTGRLATRLALAGFRTVWYSAMRISRMH